MYNRLVAVIVPSGSGKDALIAGARTMLANYPAYYFTTREIKRPSSTTGERHIFVSEEEFRQRHGSCQYTISWSAHSTLYCINKNN